MRTDEVYLEYITTALENVAELTRVGRKAFLSDKHAQAAVLYYLHTMAEATQRLSSGLKERHPEIDWIAIGGFRNRIVHGYLGINMDIVWGVIEGELPLLRSAIASMRLHATTESSEADESGGEA